MANATAVFTMPSYSVQADNNQLSAQTTNSLGLVPNHPVTWETSAGGSIAPDGTTEQVVYNNHPTKDVTVNGAAGQSECNRLTCHCRFNIGRWCT